ncbi:class I SAM-dependent methyltransferase [Clostridium senegalense]|uniref:class I SAM-dependent methyltransferase n=1 Tax=Clostridium senegalense TaxID=1465809 RepID=UPI00028A04C0|nr:class I SAM-dependent methyltransferase [Clostridium senegalense]
MINYYGNLCTEMYEILHEKAPEDELAFYLSYATSKMKIFEPLCGSGRFLIPFYESGFNIKGLDLSKEMLSKLTEKLPEAQVTNISLENYNPKEQFDYIFISSGSVSLFTDMNICKSILQKIYTLLKKGGKFVFAVDTVANKGQNEDEYKIIEKVKTRNGLDLVLKTKNIYNPTNKILYSPSIYELRDNEKIIKAESMDFQIRLYELGELEEILYKIGFSEIKVYSSFSKKIAKDNNAEMFLYECQV